MDLSEESVIEDFQSENSKKSLGTPNPLRYKLNEDFIFKDRQIHLTEKGKSKVKWYKKLTGSRIGAVFGNDKFRSPFQLWCEIFKFFDEGEDERSTYFLRAGKIIEKILREYLELKTGLKFKIYDPSEISYDLFKDNEIFGGVPDGEELDENGNVISILEIKTASMSKYYWVFEDNEYKLKWIDNAPVIKSDEGGLKKWFKNGKLIIPAHYKDQLSLYLYLRGITKGYFCIAFLKDIDYKNPTETKFISEFNNYENYVANPKTFLSSQEHILVLEKFNLDLESFSSKIKQAKKWYLNHVIEGISPKMTDKDLEWFMYWYPELTKLIKEQERQDYRSIYLNKTKNLTFYSISKDFFRNFWIIYIVVLCLVMIVIAIVLAI